MKTKVASLTHKASLWAIGSLAALLVAGAPAFAQHGGGGGGGHGGGGGGHSMGGGGGHSGGFGARGGGFGGARGYSGGFAGARASGFGGGYSGARPMGFSGGHAISASAGAHFVPRGTVSGFRGGYAGGHVGSVSVYHNNGVVARSAFVGRGAYGYGYGRGGFGYHRPYWGGGYWRGGYWPRCYYGWSYPWFLGVLPGVYATYWWGGVPYYYANNVYYTWNPGYNGYVVTDPPPADGEDSGSTSAPADGSYDSAEPGPNGASAAPSGSGSGEVYAYPKSGQSDEQQATDRYECHKWAVAQSGYDPTRGSQASGNTADYRRAMVACLDGRGYSTK